MKKDFFVFTLIILAVLLIVSPIFHGFNMQFMTQENNVNPTTAAQTQNINNDTTKYTKNTNKSENSNPNENERVFPLGAVIMLFMVSAAAVFGHKCNSD